MCARNERMHLRYVNVNYGYELKVVEVEVEVEAEVDNRYLISYSQS